MLKRPDTRTYVERSATALVVDDAIPARFLVQNTLCDVGLDTLVACDGEAAFRMVQDFHPDAVVTDLEMPGMDGEELIERTRSSNKPCIRELPIIVASSKVDGVTEENLERLRVDTVVPKPINVRLLATQALRLFKAA